MSKENLKLAYEELCKSYHAIDDFRTKLLGFLPLATGAGIVFAAKEDSDLLNKYPMPIGAFGFVIALGLFCYEIYGIKKCGALIVKGKQIELQLGFEGQFVKRPQEAFWVINEPFAAALIYPAVMASWAYLAFHQTPQVAWKASAGIFGVFFLAIFGYCRWLAYEAEREAMPPLAVEEDESD